MVLTPEMTMSPPSISISPIFEFLSCVTPARVDCELDRMSATDAGGLGRSEPSSWYAGSVRQMRTYALVFGCRLLTVVINWPALRGLEVRIARKSDMFAVFASATVKLRVPGSAPIGTL